MIHFLAMGGYGRFVWSAYGVSAAALTGAVVITLRAYSRAASQLNRMQNEKRPLSE